jgi:hypothetical protein
MLYFPNWFEATKHEIYLTEPLQTDMLRLKTLCFFKRFLPIIMAVRGDAFRGIT